MLLKNWPPGAYYKIAKNPNFKGPECHENIFKGKFSVQLKNWASGAFYKIAKNLNFEGPCSGPEGHENIFFGILYTDSRYLKLKE